MELFKNLIYEYQKGMRDLSLHTCNKSNLQTYTQILNQLNTQYITTELPENKVNIYFGNPLCLKILKNFSSTKLNEITPQEDFILGIMLGYSRQEQYQRILTRI